MQRLICANKLKNSTKKMYLEIANSECNYISVSDAVTSTASKCRQYIDGELNQESNTVLTIPDNPTNGDMIKALFPNNRYVEGEKFVIIIGETENITLWNNWWNAPYKPPESKGKE